MCQAVLRMMPLAIAINLGMLIGQRLGVPVTTSGLLDVMARGGERARRLRGARAWLHRVASGLDRVVARRRRRADEPHRSWPRTTSARDGPASAVASGVSTLVNLADPNTVGTLVGTVVVVLMLAGGLGLLLVTPFARLGYWAYGPNQPPPQQRGVH